MTRVGVMAGILIYAISTFQWVSTIAAAVGCISGLYALVRVARLEDIEKERATSRSEKADLVLSEAIELDDQLRPPDV